MEAKINIVEILKDKPQGTMLYSSACGKCKLEEVDDNNYLIPLRPNRSIPLHPALRSVSLTSPKPLYTSAPCACNEVSELI